MIFIRESAGAFFLPEIDRQFIEKRREFIVFYRIVYFRLSLDSPAPLTPARGVFPASRSLPHVQEGSRTIRARPKFTYSANAGKCAPLILANAHEHQTNGGF